MTNVHEIIEKARAARQRLPPNEATLLFAAAVRLAAAQGATLRARLVQIDDSGRMQLAPFDDQAPETEPGYLAPELQAADAPRKSEPRVQVFAAGALGFELLTGHVPPGSPTELSGPLGDIVRMALAPDRRERFGDLTQLQDALEGVQPRPPAEGERNIFAALKMRWTRPPPEKEAVARLIEKLAQLEGQVAQIAKAQAKLEAAQRQAMEQLDRFEGGQQRPQRPAPGVAGPALLAGLLAAAAVLAAGWALGLIPAPRRAAPLEPAAVAQVPPAEVSEPPVAPPPAAATPPRPKSASAEKSAAAVPEKSASPDAAAEKSAPPGAAADPSAPPGAAAETSAAAADKSSPPADPGASPDAAVAAAPPDAGSPALAVARRDEARPEAPAPAKRRKPEVTQAQLLHAVAISQVRRGESALERGNSDEALASFHAALENEAFLPVAFRGMGMAYAMQGNDARALEAYQKYLQLAPAAGDKSDIRRSINELKARAKIGADK